MSPRLDSGLIGRRPHRDCGRSGFSLVELLTVVGIIALLMGILLPAMSAAKIEAKRAATRAVLASIDRGLEMFNTDFGTYPESKRRLDPIVTWNNPAIPDNKVLSGAHWLARAMYGHDYLYDYGPAVAPTARGLDYNGRSLSSVPPTIPFEQFQPETSAPNPTRKAGSFSKRRAPYVQKISYVLDDSFKHTLPGSVTCRGVLTDNFNFPILYYRANARGQKPFGETYAQDANATPRATSVYYQEDNADLTGGEGGANGKTGWLLSEGAMTHGMGVFGEPATPTIKASKVLGATGKEAGLAFIGSLYDGKSRQAVRSDSYVLITPGPDGIWGTTDDVSNFK